MNRKLLVVAKNVIKKHLDIQYNPVKKEKEWEDIRATFVTLTIDNKLRGCIGSLVPTRTIFEDIKHNAYVAAFEDPRFPQLTKAEIDNLKIEISILTTLKEINFTTEKDILNKIIPDKIGLLLEYGFNRGTFLPQVWEVFPEPIDFFNNLKQKAGLSTDFFDTKMKLFYYEVEICKE